MEKPGSVSQRTGIGLKKRGKVGLRGSRVTRKKTQSSITEVEKTGAKESAVKGKGKKAGGIPS